MGLAPAPGVDPLDVIVGYVDAHPHLIVLDGCERHVDEVATIADRLLTSSEHCWILATSREPLGLGGESTIRLGGLPADEAVTMFIDRAGLSTPLQDELARTVVDVCDALDGMALAIELAASRARSIPIERLKQRIDDQMPLLKRRTSIPGRHSSMETTLAWSYNLLADDKQRVFRWLSTFRTGISIDDACGLLDDPNAEDILTHLVDVSLLQPPDDHGEHHFLEAIRQYAATMLRTSGDERDARLGHARWMASEATRFSLAQWTPARRELSDWLYRRRFDMYEAAHRAVAHDAPDVTVEIVAGVGRRLAQSGAAGDLLPAALAAFDHEAVIRSPRLAVAMAHVAWMLANEDLFEEAVSLIERATGIAEATEDRSAMAHVRERTALLQAQHEVSDEDVALIDEAVALLEEEGLPELTATYHNRAVMLYWPGRSDEAYASFTAANDLWQHRFGEPLASYLESKASMEMLEGDWDTAVSLMADAAELWERHIAYSQAGYTWWTVAWAAYVMERPDLMSVAVDRHRRIETIAGIDRPPSLDMWSGAMQHRWDDVLSAASRWFALRTDRPLENPDLISEHAESTMLGTPTMRPRIFWVLHPLATALHATGRTAEACEIAREVPGLMARSSYMHWREMREMDLWQDLIDHCRDDRPEGVTLVEMFDHVRQLLSSLDSGP